MKEQNKMLNPDLSHTNEIRANNAEFYYASINDNHLVKSQMNQNMLIIF